MTSSVSNTQLNLRIISIVVFTCILLYLYRSAARRLAWLYPLPAGIQYAYRRCCYQPCSTSLRCSAARTLDVIRTSGDRKSRQSWDRLLSAERLFTLCCGGAATVPLAISALLIGCLFLGVGESFTATGATLWGIKTVGAMHTSRVISWNGVATYVAMAVGAPSV
jgi:hypothetical protein